ncbi:MAG TPA: GNAT family N-acetyltransferase [Thiotrichaceae bacterium]|nr:GNAT family N-acetyltransferase [Thiotrichaceae bacterium]
MCGFEIKSKLLANKELKAVAALHSQSINLGFLSQLGNSFLFYLYKSLSESDGSILILAKYEDDIVGFVSGSVGLGSVYKHLVRHHFVGVALALTPNIFSLSKLKRIFETLFYSTQDDGPEGLPRSELLSLAVQEDFRKSGVATKMCQELIKQFRKNGLSTFKIIVGEELQGAQRFYENMGAVKVGIIEVHKGSKSLVYRLEI